MLLIHTHNNYKKKHSVSLTFAERDISNVYSARFWVAQSATLHEGTGSITSSRMDPQITQINVDMAGTILLFYPAGKAFWAEVTDTLFRTENIDFACLIPVGNEGHTNTDQKL